MKLFITLLLLTTTAHAAYFPVGKPDAKTSYARKAVCESQESFTCWDIRGKDLRYMVPGTKEVDDLSKPIHEAESAVTVCTDLESCSDILNQEFTDSYCEDNGQTDQHFPVIAEDYSRVYCTQLLGYEQMTVPALVEDAGLKAAADAADAAEAAERSARDSKQVTRDAELDACARQATPNAAQVAACMRAIAKELAQDRLDESEL